MARRERLKKVSDKEFKTSKEWLQRRATVMERQEGKCMMCGRSTKEHGVVIDVSLIKPRRDYPELQLDINNFQILCEECIQGRGNRHETDWRPSI